MAELKGNKYGTHRVIEPKGVLTQAAWKIDNDMSKVYSNEIVCDVTSLNIDSASFTQISEACGGDEKKIGEMILGIVAERGKQQNPVTGSGGMFKGVVAHIGEDLKKKPGFDLKEGDKIVSLVSLSMTPLKIDKILAIHKDIDRVDIVGKAILFESALYCKMPDDMSEPLALAALDVAGAPAQARKLPHEGDNVLPRRERQVRRAVRLGGHEEGRPEGQGRRRCTQSQAGARSDGARRLHRRHRRRLHQAR